MLSTNILAQYEKMGLRKGSMDLPVARDFTFEHVIIIVLRPPEWTGH